MHTGHSKPHASGRMAAGETVHRRGGPAGFTDFQWYCFQSRQTVHFAAYSTKAYSVEDLIDLARELMVYAPQLTTGYAGARPGMPADDETLAQLVAVTPVESLSGYPDAWPVNADPFDARPDLPLFRITAAVQRIADGRGCRSVLQVLATHALLEGADSALLLRSQSAGRNDEEDLPAPRQSKFQRLLTALYAAALAPLQLAVAGAFAPYETDFGRKSIILDRNKLWRVALAYGVRQRSLMFALVAYALNDHGRGFGSKRLNCTYTDLDNAANHRQDGEFFRFRLMEARFPVIDDFRTFAAAVDEEIGRVEARDATATQRRIVALFGVHRRLKRIVPFFYSRRIFRFTGFYHLDLSLVPPHRLSGPLSEGLIEPVFCGTLHEGLNACVFVPGKRYLTLSFDVRRKHLEQTGAIVPLLDRLDAELAAA